MRLNKITLYKTQLGNDYKNVIDGGMDYSLTKQMLKEFIFDPFYSPNVIYNGETKSYKEINGETEITISARYEDILDYNYAIIENASGYFFYFITAMESLNDGENPSVSLLLERDSWNNNIEYLSNRTFDDMQFVSRSHFQRFYDDGTQRTFYPIYYNSDDYTSFTKYNDEQFMYIKNPYVLWIGFRVSGDAGIKLDSLNYERIGDSSTYDTTGGNVLDSIAPIFYMPIAIVSGFEDGAPTLDFSFSMTNGTVTANYSNILKDIKRRMDFTSQIFMEAICTVFPPFDYNVNDGVITVGSGVTITNKTLYTSADDGTILQIWSKDMAYNSNENDYYIISASNDSGIRGKWYHTYTTPIQSFTADSEIGTKLWDAYSTYDEVKLYEPRVYCSPFYDMSFSWGDFTKHIDVILDKTLLCLSVDTRLKTQGSFSLFLDDNALSLYNTIPQIGNLPTSSDKWEGERAAAINDILGGTINGLIGSTPSTTNQTSTKRLTTTGSVNRLEAPGDKGRLRTVAKQTLGPTDTTITKTGTSISSPGGLIGGAAGAIKGMTSTIERQNIIASQSLHSNQPSVIGTDNFAKQIPKIVYEKWVKESEIDEVLGSVFLYGYTHPASQSVKYNCRVWFDYCETVDCTLPKIHNLYDRYTIENAFNRGITKWHYNEGFGINASFNKLQNNPERIYVSAEDAQIAFDFGGLRPDKNHGTLGDVISLQGNNTIDNGVIDLNNGTIYFDKTAAELGLLSKTGDTITYAMEFSEIDTSQNGWLLWLHPANSEAYNAGGFRSSIEGNVLKAITNNASVAAGASYNISESLANKTITCSFYIPTSIYDYLKIRVFVEGVQVGEYSAQYKSAYMNGGIWQFGSPTQGVCNAKLSKFKIWYETLGDAWTESEASTHLL
jgi:hypothetical protein